MPVEPCDFLCCAALMENKKRHEGERERAKKKKNWPLRHRSLNKKKKKKTKPNAYLNVWGRRGFTSEQSCSNMRYLHSVQLPSHCGLGKQYSSPILPPPPKKKPPPKLVFLWPVIKTWVWMRASVSPGKITHTHSQWRGTNAGYSPPLLNIWLERNDLSSPPSWLAVTDPGTFDTCPRVSVHTHTLPYTCMCGQKRKKPSATYWLGLELREFWPLSHDNLPDLHQDLQKGRGVRAKPPHKTTRTQKPSCRSSESNFHHWGKMACVLTSRRHVRAQKRARASVFF